MDSKTSSKNETRPIVGKISRYIQNIIWSITPNTNTGAETPIKEIIADGISVISENIDLANVRLIFNNGCVANLTASRISNKNMRKIRVFEQHSYTSVDLLNKEVLEYSATKNSNTNDLTFDSHQMDINNQDALAAELTCFCNAILNDDYNDKNISAAILALDIANQINHIIQNKRK